ncbi:1-acyl-sn-glycerol-3-phosphate acyltransferase [Filobacillus milosensis]|uniref:1-acyl-sn-glycerol-3-phosphate acyltransferase n=1 Tax=Filobacillus milosensis TaxID=94137 RepID=A0A4Y8IEB2_9BACI|nr:lysophospholipid acyltransferase family protein [Filobacillus milosensis]TFB14628.1 1-acyl-sn-glycerol-3-phosphate acyltransferase [Filobacillus milosensis]
MSIEKKPSKLVQHMLLGPIRAFINLRSDIQVVRNDTKGLKPPYVILSNHVNNWDPLILNSYVDEPICYIAGEPLFRHPFLKHVLNYVGAIRKTKFTNDTSTIRNVLKAKKHGRVIGVFPEGNRNWDGYNEPLIYSTSKLVKLLDVPVVFAKIKGGYLSHPRWGDGHRKGKIELTFEQISDQGDFINASIEDIHNRLTEAMHHDEMAWQRDHKNQYISKHPAHYLERLLFVCPHCQTPGYMYSNKDEFRCLNCNYLVTYTPEGHFESINQPTYHLTPYEWKNWQLQFLRENLFRDDLVNVWGDCLKDPVKLYVSYDQQPFKLVGEGTLTWNNQQFDFINSKDQITFSIHQADGINIQFHHKLDFLYHNAFYRLVFYQPRSSAYKWLQVTKQIKKQEGVSHGT